MTDFATFGDPSKFEIAVRWTDDPEPRERRPAHGGWSTGELRLIVGGHNLTHHRRGTANREAAHWYLLPLFEWLANNWVSLLHEEHFDWQENSAAPAATAVFLALRRTIDLDDADGQASYVAVQNWWSRHALRAADASALYPDVSFRRYGDAIEISWTARQPVFAPDGFQFALTPGVATLPIADVAQPFWEVLAWAVSTAHPVTGDDRGSVSVLEQRLEQLNRLSTATLEAGYLPSSLFEQVVEAKNRRGLPDTSIRMSTVPAVDLLDAAVLMFGGVSPDLGMSDIESLTAFMAECIGGDDNEVLSARVDTDIGVPLIAPYQEGYDLAESLLEDLGLPGDTPAIDLSEILTQFGVTIREVALNTQSIRGAAVAGANYKPAILVNTASMFNASKAGYRFTLAHELFHILYDRTRARRLAHSSGRWTSPGVEKRANAFAAMLLMPRDLIRRSLGSGEIDRETITTAANMMVVSASALIEHLYNTSVIDEIAREDLRSQFRMA